MQKQITSSLQKTVFGEYSVSKEMPFRIVQAPFRSFGRYNRDGHWNQKQRQKYTVFLQFFRAIFEDPLKKKHTRIYEMMSDMIVTRNPNQCRSHHQKMERYGNGISEIIAVVAEKYEPRVFRDIEEKYLALIKNLLQNCDKYIRPFSADESRKVKLKRELSFCTESQRHQPTLTKRCLQPKSQPKLLSRQNLALAKTDDKYEEEDQFKKPEEQEEEPPFIDGQPLKEQCKDNDIFYREIPQEQANQKAAEMENILFMLGSDCHPMFAAGSRLAPFSLKEYEQLLKRVEYEREWHLQNVNHLKQQLQNSEKAINLCEARIKFLKESCQNNRLCE